MLHYQLVKIPTSVQKWLETQAYKTWSLVVSDVKWFVMHNCRIIISRDWVKGKHFIAERISLKITQCFGTQTDQRPFSINEFKKYH